MSLKGKTPYYVADIVEKWRQAPPTLTCLSTKLSARTRGAERNAQSFVIKNFLFGRTSQSSYFLSWSVDLLSIGAFGLELKKCVSDLGTRIPANGEKCVDLHYACDPRFALWESRLPHVPRGRMPLLWQQAPPFLPCKRAVWGGKPAKMNLGNFWDVSADPSSTWGSKRRPKVRDQSGGSKAWPKFPGGQFYRTNKGFSHFGHNFGHNFGHTPGAPFRTATLVTPIPSPKCRTFSTHFTFDPTPHASHNHLNDSGGPVPSLLFGTRRFSRCLCMGCGHMLAGKDT